MAETTATETESKSAPGSTFTEFNVRQYGGRPHFIRLHDRVVKSLERQLAAVSGGNFGILLGSIDSGESCTIDVEEFAPVVSVRESIRARSAERVIGYYRTHARPEFVLDSSDIALFKRCFPNGPRLALLVKPPKTGVGTAMFFLGEDGLLAGDRSTVEFPFNLQELGAEEPAVVPVVKAQIVKVPPVVAAEPARSPWKVALACTTIVGSILGLYAFRQFNQRTPAPLAVERPAPVSQQVAPTPVTEEESRPTPPARPTPVAVAPARRPVIAPQPLRPSPPQPEIRRTPEPPPSQTSATATPAAQPQPPIAAPVAEPQPAAANAAPAREPIPSASPVRTTPPEPIKPYVAPRAIRKFAPVVRDSVHRMMTREVTVRVRAQVDGTGKVIAVDALNVTNPVTRGLAEAAVAAVKQWEFEPALRGNEKVPGDIELSFTFRQ